MLFFFVVSKKCSKDSNLNGLHCVFFFFDSQVESDEFVLSPADDLTLFSAMPRCEKKDTTMDVTKIVETTNECLCQERAGGMFFLGDS